MTLYVVVEFFNTTKNSHELSSYSHLQSEWDAERILTAAEEFWKSRAHSFEEEVFQRFGQELGEDYWERVEANLQSGTLRLIIAADEIPSELRTVIEFLNETARFDVLGLEVRFFSAESDSAPILAPQIVGSTERARERKRTIKRAVGSWDEVRFFEVLAETYPEREKTARILLRLAGELTNQRVRWGTGTQTGSFTAHTKIEGRSYSLYSVYTDGTFSINIGWSAEKLAEIDPELAERYRQLANNTFGIELERSAWLNGFPKAPLPVLDDQIEKFRSYLERFVEEVTKQ